MSIPGNAEPGVFSRQQQVHPQQTIPIKKRRFPVIQSSSSQEESPSVVENKEKSNIDDGGLSSSAAINSASLSNTDVAQTSITAVKKEVVPTDTPLAQANVDIHASKPVDAKPKISLGPLGDLGNNKVGLQKEKSTEPTNPGSSVIAQTSDVKREIVGRQTEGASRLQLSGGKMNVELSLGLKEPLVPALKSPNEAILHTSDKSDSLLSLALHEEKVVLRDKTVDTVSNPVCANRSNWDLNTTMDVWEGSTTSDAFAHGLVSIGGFSKSSIYHDDRSSLTVASTAFLASDKGKHVLDGHTSSSSKSSTQLCKTDVSLGLGLAMSNMNTNWERACSSGNLDFTSITPSLSLKQVPVPVVNASRPVKSEPADDNSKHDSSIGSCSSNNMESLKLTSIKRECGNNHGIDTILQSHVSPEKLDDQRLMKSEALEERKQEASKLKVTAVQYVARTMQHQESCASSSALPVSLLSQGPSPTRLSSCSELTTTEDISNQSEQSFHTRESQRYDVSNELTALPIRQDNNKVKNCKLGIADQVKCKLAPIDEDTVKLPQNDEGMDEKMDISNEMLEEDTFGSDSESQQNVAVDTICGREDEEYEDGEVREHVRHSAEGDPIAEGKNTDNLELVISDSQNLQLPVPSADQSIKENDVVKKSLDENHIDQIKDYTSVCHGPNSEINSLQQPYEVSAVVADEKREIGVTADRQLDLSREDVYESPRKEGNCDIPTDGNGVEIGGEATAKLVNESCSVEENDLTLSKVEASPNGHDSAKDSNNAGNKSRIINLSRPSVMAAPFRTKSISNRLMTTRCGKERFSDFGGEAQPRGNRDEFYSGGSNKFVKDRVHDQSVRNSRPTFMRGKGRSSGYFGGGRGEWDSDHDFASERNSYGPSDYRVIRRKNDVDLECNDGYNIPQDGNRRKPINGEFRRGSFRRGDRDGPASRGFHMLHRGPRNTSPRHCSVEAGSDMIGLRNDDKFMQHLSDDINNPPIYGHPQAMYDERGNRNFSQRKGYPPRIHSKSPARSRTRSPGPWSSPRRRSPNGAPAFYRMGGRMRSPDQSCFHDEMAARRRGGSPSYVARHNNDLRDVDSHIHPRSADSNRRASPGRGFPRSARRAPDGLDSREMGDGDEYLNGPNKFHGDGTIDDGRKFVERRGPIRPFRPNYNSPDNENFRFPPNDGPRPYRFCPDSDTEFVERSNTREREFDGRIKHHNVAGSRRIRNIEDQQDGNYRPVERVWHDDGFGDGRVKRRRF